jgi:type I restriction enzyme M protein
MILSYRDDLEHEKVVAAELAGKPYAFIIDKLHRWSSWAAPKMADGPSCIAGQVDGARV